MVPLVALTSFSAGVRPFLLTGWSKTASVVNGGAATLPLPLLIPLPLLRLAIEESLCSDRAELKPLELDGRLDTVAAGKGRRQKRLHNPDQAQFDWEGYKSYF